MRAMYRAQDEDGDICDYENKPTLSDMGWWKPNGDYETVTNGKINLNWKTACFDLSEGEPVIIDGILCAPGTISMQYATNRTPEQFDEHLRTTSCTGQDKIDSTIADKAKEIIYGDRESTYGDPGKNLNVIASMWSTYTGSEITAQDVCNMMILLKVARLKNTPKHEDSLVDIIGYTLLKERTK